MARRRVSGKSLVFVRSHPLLSAIGIAGMNRLVRFNVLPPDAPDPPPGATPPDEELAEIGEVWGYFAIDAADEWWVEWGLLRLPLSTTFFFGAS